MAQVVHYHRKGMFSHFSSKELHWVLYISELRCSVCRGLGTVTKLPLFKQQRRNAFHFLLYSSLKNNLALDHFSCMGFNLPSKNRFSKLRVFFACLFCFVWFCCWVFFKTEGKLITEKSYLALPWPDQHYHIWELQDKM